MVVLRYHLSMHAALNSSVKMDWQTPDSLLELVRKVGPIALDPCTVAENPTQATYICTPETDGLLRRWSPVGGLTYVNPPYGRELGKWVSKCMQEGARGAEIVLLTPARPDTIWFQMAAPGAEPMYMLSDPPVCQARGADALLFWRGRLKFKGAPASAPFPSALFYWGPRHERFREVFAGRGLFL